MSLRLQEAPRLILASGTFFCENLVMKIFLRPFFLFFWFKKSSCQLIAKECRPKFSLMNIFSALEGSKLFIIICCHCSWMLCHVAAIKSLPALIYSADYILLLVLWDHGIYSESSELILLDSFSEQIWNNFVFFDLFQSLKRLLCKKLQIYRFFPELHLPDL